MSSEKAPKHSRDFAGNASKGSASLPQDNIQFYRPELALQRMLNQLPLRLESLTVRMPFIQPVRQQTSAHLRQTPHKASVNEAGDVVPVWVIAPNLHFGDSIFVHGHVVTG